MIITPQQRKKALLKQAINEKIENYRGKGHNKSPHNKMKFNNKIGR